MSERRSHDIVSKWTTNGVMYAKPSRTIPLNCILYLENTKQEFKRKNLVGATTPPSSCAPEY